MRTNGRRRLLTCLLLIVAMEAQGFALANHAGPSGGPSLNVVDPGELDTVPIVDTARDEVLARQAEAIRNLNSFLASRGVDADTLVPETPANVFSDHVHPGGRVGGLGPYIRSPGAPWRVQAGGVNGTYWTVSNATTGKYGQMDASLVLPVIDLSAYPLQTGGIPFLNPNYGQGNTGRGTAGGLCPDTSGATTEDTGLCPFIRPFLPEASPLQDQINLLLKHRYNFLPGRDGAQVLVYERDPSVPGARSTLLTPQLGQHRSGITALGGSGYTGHSDWTTESYDLTAWAGKRIWIVLRVAAVAQASADPNYFSSSNFPRNAFYGWDVDDLEVVSPAYPNNLKVESILGPAFRPEPGAPRVVAPGANVTVGAEVLNAAATRRLARVTLTVEGGDVPLERTFLANLSPGEVWTPNVTVQAPLEGSLRVRAFATNPGPENTTLVDPTMDDNDGNATFEVVEVARVVATLRPSATMVDDGESVTARADLLNSGNVPLDLDVRLEESYGDPDAPTVRPIGATRVTLGVGQNVTYVWALPSSPRGEHRLELNLTSLYGRTITRAAYYVHAAPPSVFNATTWPPKGIWEASVANRPIPPEDDWVWTAYSGSRMNPVLRATPTPEAVAAGGQFTDLWLTIRYMSVLNLGDASVRLAYPNPIQTTTPNNGPPIGSIPFWSDALPRSPTPGVPHPLGSELGLGWRTYSKPIDPPPGNGYSGVWTSAGPELNIIPTLTFESNADRDKLLYRFYLDDVRLTGIPLGGDESDRVDIIRITGAEPYPEAGQGAPPVSPTSAGVVAPGQPSVCSWERGGTADAANCWRPEHKNYLLERAYRNLHWSDRGSGGAPFTFPDGGPAVVGYVHDAHPTTVTRPPERLVTPAFTFDEVVSPRLDFETLYAFPGYPRDFANTGEGPKYHIDQVGYVELQYKRDDGTWSDFYRIVPEDGYLSPVFNDARLPVQSEYHAMDGLHHPSPCDSPHEFICDAGGFHLNRGPDGLNHWVDFGPYAHKRLTFNLDKVGVNLSNREVRIGFHATSAPVVTACPHACRTQWLIRDLRVSPVATFAVDGTVMSVNLSVPYDWRAIGVGPDTIVPVNVTIRNSGQYAERFELNFTVSLLNGEDLPYQDPIDVGELAPGEVRHVIVPWSVPLGENRNYVLKARLVPASAADEKPYDDEATLGGDGTLLAVTRSDAAISGTVYPQRGRETLARRTPVVLYNRGNVPLDDVHVTRTIEIQTGAGPRVQREVTWRLAEPLPPNPAGVALQQLAVEPELRPEDLYHTPGEAGDYLATFRVTNDDGDASIKDNAVTIQFMAGEPIFAEDFEEPVRWATNAPDLWGEGEGFQSLRSLLAANRTTGAIATRNDTWIVTPPVKLSSAMSAVVNAFVKYDLESGYDGARFEVSKDGVTWLPIQPTDERGLRGAYPGTVIPSNPLSGGALDAPGAFTGDSRDSPLQTDGGWTPVSFDLQDVPELRESVAFRDLRAPDGVESETPQYLGGGTFVSPRMVIDPSLPEARWEIQNLTDDVRSPLGNSHVWWSGRGSPTTTTVVAVLSRVFPLAEHEVAAGDTLALTWWDWRAGTRNTSWQGISGTYDVNLIQKNADGVAYSVEGDLVVGAPVGDWYPMRITAKKDLLALDRDLTVEFRLTSRLARASDMGWALDGIRLATERVENGRLTFPEVLTPETDEDLAKWTRVSGWTREEKIPARPIPWRAVKQTGADNLPRTVWRADIDPTLHANSDTRLVTPLVDLSEVGGARVALRLTHQYDLAWDEQALEPGMSLGQKKAYRAGAVEVQVRNRTTGEWDPWRQLFAPGKAPAEGLADRPPMGNPTEGAPYNRTLVEAGDSFQRFPRRFDQVTGFWTGLAQTQIYFHDYVANLSYAYGNKSLGTGFVQDEFDLTPFAGQEVRFGFHAYAGAVDPQGKARSWAIDNAQVVGYVLSSPDVQLRMRLATDASIQQGSFAVDQLEVSGRRYERSVAIELDPVPTKVEPDGNVRVKGRLVNYGPETRHQVAIGVRENRLRPITEQDESGFRLVLPITARPGSPAPKPYAAISGPFDLTPAGTVNSSVPFEFNIGFGAVGRTYNVTLDLLEATFEGAAFTYAQPRDDVPGRARRSFDIRTEDVTAARIDAVAFTPTALAAPGPVVVRGAGLNTGTREADLTLRAEWVTQDGVSAGETTRAIGKVRPGAAFAYELPPMTPATAGNYTVTVRAFAPSTTSPIATAVAYYRVARTDVNHTAGFDGTLDGWTTEGMFALADDDAAYGNTSLLFGYNNSRFIDERLSLEGATGALTSPPLDLQDTAKERTLSFWHKPLMRGGRVLVFLDGLTAGEPDPRCSGNNALLLDTITGRQDRWQLASLSLDHDWRGCSTRTQSFQLRFVPTEVVGQGWRVDAVTVGSGNLTLRQAKDVYAITDSAVKEYPIIVTNPGEVPKEVELGIDPLLSRLSDQQMKWLRVTPRVLHVEPGGTGVATLRVDTPAARGAFQQTLDAVLSATDRSAPYAPAGMRLRLEFQPLPRQDLSVAASVDGRPLGTLRADVEEAVPHEVSVVITNQGAEESNPTQVVFEILDDATGKTLWTQTRNVPALGPYAETEESFLASGSWKPSFGARGNHTLRVIVDPEHTLVDYDRSNDDVRIPLAVVRLIRPDLVVDPRSFSVSTPAGIPVYEAVPGQLVRVSAAVTNDGYADARDVTLRLLAGTSVLKEELVPLLRAGETHILRANQFAPNASVTYRVMAFTPDLELLSENNERSLELPVFPAEVRIEAEALDAMDPGTTRIVNVTVADDGPYPLVLRLETRSGGPQARLDATTIALGPGESRVVPLRITAAPDERAGTHLVVVRALDGDGPRAQRTIPVNVAERPAALLLPHVARGPPGALLVQLDAVNTGNVALDAAVVVTSQGKELARVTLDDLAQGRRDLVSLKAALPPETPPQRMAATLSLVRDGVTLASAPIDLDVRPYSELDVRATPRPDGAFDVRVEHRGNANATRDVVLLDVPPGVDARPSATRLTLPPGGAADFTVNVDTHGASANGLFKLQVALVDPAPADGAAKPHLAPLTLDLRSAKLDIADVRRDEASPTEGRTVTYRAVIRNDGAKDAKGTPVELYVDGLLVDRKEVPDLPPGQTTTIDLTWDAAAGAHGIVLAIDAHGPLGEDAPAYTERLQVASSVVPGASFARDLPLPALGWVVLVVAAVALARRRSPWRP